ncbi:uncharacterized protein [Coffea arabica]|uniref:Reverse transcriptase n=1 Tax=Coffea arabica TaxID=13443 RepID=A0ABM4WPW1_COFAR
MADKAITGIKVGRNCRGISHLFFADDALLCCKAIPQEAQVLKDILEKYAKASGQQVNFDKFAAYFRRNTNLDIRRTICGKLGNLKEAYSGKYLGLPMVIGKSLKAMVIALPNHTMSCFKLLKGLCRDICKQIANFWWGIDDQKRKVHWIKWRSITEIKGKGGLGFRDLEHFNTTLLAKQLWRILLKLNILVSKVLKAKYMRTDYVLYR